MRIRIDLASLTVGCKFTVFALFYFVVKGNFPRTSSSGAYIWRGDLTEGFFALPLLGGLYLEGIIHEGAYFRNFCGISGSAFTVSTLFLLIRCEQTHSVTTFSQEINSKTL